MNGLVPLPLQPYCYALNHPLLVILTLPHQGGISMRSWDQAYPRFIRQGKYWRVIVMLHAKLGIKTDPRIQTQEIDHILPYPLLKMKWNSQ